MVRVKLNVKVGVTDFSISVLGESIEEAVRYTKRRFNTSRVSVVFPLSEDFFVPDTSGEEMQRQMQPAMLSGSNEHPPGTLGNGGERNADVGGVGLTTGGEGST